MLFGGKMFRECETHMVFTEKALTERIRELDLVTRPTRAIG